MLDISYYEKTDEIIAQYTCEEKSLIPIIQGIQEEYRYLPPELLTYVAEKLGISEAKAYSVASFYENFSFEAKGKYVIKVIASLFLLTANNAASFNKFSKSAPEYPGVLSAICFKFTEPDKILFLA